MGFFSNLTKAVKSTVKTFASPKGLATLAVMVGTAGIGAGLAAGSITSFGGAVSALASSSTWMAGLTSVGISLGLGAVAQALSPPDNAFDGRSIQDLGAQGAKFQFRSPVAVREIVYGETRKSGVITSIDTDNGSGGSGTEYLQMVIAVSADKTSGISKFFVNDQIVKNNVTNVTSGSITPDNTTDPDYSGTMLIVYKDGSYPQTPGGDKPDSLSNESTHRMDGISYVYVRLQYNATVYSEGIPNFSFLIKGKEVFDPRDGSTEYSNNPALCIRDYLLNQTYGLGCSLDEIDEDSFETAADVCDDEGYELNGVVSTDKSPATIIKDMLTSCSGTIRYSNGKFSMLAAKYVPPVKTITEDDLIADVSITSANSIRDSFNEVKAIHYSSGLNQVRDIPVQFDEEILFKDANEISSVDLSLPFTTNPTRATELAQLALYRGQNQLTAQISVNLKHFDVAVGDNIYFDYPRLGFDQKIFEVTSWGFSASGPNIGINLGLRENSEASYSSFPPSGRSITRIRGALNVAIDLENYFDDWDEETDKVLLIDSVAKIVGDWDGSNQHEPAITINQNLAGTLTIYNRGQIYGVQGIFDDPSSKPADGGDAISIFYSVASNVTIINDGVIAGGGGAGGNGGRSRESEVWDTSGGFNAFKYFGGGGPNDGGDGAGWNGLKVIPPEEATTIGTSGGTSVRTSDPYDYLDPYGDPQQLPAQDVNLYFGADGGDGGGFGEDGETGLTGPTSESQQNGGPDPQGGGPTFGIALKWYPPYGPPQDSQGNDLLGFAPTVNAGSGGAAVSGGANAEIINRQSIYGSIS